MRTRLVVSIGRQHPSTLSARPITIGSPGQAWLAGCVLTASPTMAAPPCWCGERLISVVATRGLPRRHLVPCGSPPRPLGCSIVLLVPSRIKSCTNCRSDAHKRRRASSREQARLPEKERGTVQVYSQKPLQPCLTTVVTQYLVHSLSLE